MSQYPPERYLIKIVKYVPISDTSFDLEHNATWYAISDDVTVNLVPARITSFLAEAVPFYNEDSFSKWFKLALELTHLSREGSKIEVYKIPYRDAIDDLINGNL